MKAFHIVFGATLITLFFGAFSAQAVPPGTCDLVLDFKLSALQQQSFNVNTPPGSNTYKSTTIKFKMTTSDLVGLLAIASGQPLPPQGTRIALYRNGFFQGQACLLDENGTPVSGFSPISTSIFAELLPSGGPSEMTNTTTPTGSRKLKTTRQMNFAMIFPGSTELQLTGFTSEQVKYSYLTGLSTYSATINVGGPGQIDGATAFFSGKISGKGPVGIGL